MKLLRITFCTTAVILASASTLEAAGYSEMRLALEQNPASGRAGETVVHFRVVAPTATEHPPGIDVPAAIDVPVEEDPVWCWCGELRIKPQRSRATRISDRSRKKYVSEVELVYDVEPERYRILIGEEAPLGNTFNGNFSVKRVAEGDRMLYYTQLWMENDTSLIKWHHDNIFISIQEVIDAVNTLRSPPTTERIFSKWKLSGLDRRDDVVNTPTFSWRFLHAFGIAPASEKLRGWLTPTNPNPGQKGIWGFVSSIPSALFTRGTIQLEDVLEELASSRATLTWTRNEAISDLPYFNLERIQQAPFNPRFAAKIGRLAERGDPVAGAIEHLMERGDRRTGIIGRLIRIMGKGDRTDRASATASRRTLSGVSQSSVVSIAFSTFSIGASVHRVHFGDLPLREGPISDSDDDSVVVAVGAPAEDGIAMVAGGGLAAAAGAGIGDDGIVVDARGPVAAEAEVAVDGAGAEVGDAGATLAARGVAVGASTAEVAVRAAGAGVGNDGDECIAMVAGEYPAVAAGAVLAVAREIGELPLDVDGARDGDGPLRADTVGDAGVGVADADRGYRAAPGRNARRPFLPQLLLPLLLETPERWREAAPDAAAGPARADTSGDAAGAIVAAATGVVGSAATGVTGAAAPSAVDGADTDAREARERILVPTRASFAQGLQRIRAADNGYNVINGPTETDAVFAIPVSVDGAGAGVGNDGEGVLLPVVIVDARAARELVVAHIGATFAQGLQRMRTVDHADDVIDSLAEADAALATPVTVPRASNLAQPGGGAADPEGR